MQIRTKNRANNNRETQSLRKVSKDMLRANLTALAGMVVLVLFQGMFSNLALAAVKLSLVTVSPGPVIFEAFGHTALVVEDSEAPGVADVYEYGAVDPSALMTSKSQEVLDKVVDLLESRVKTRVTKSTSRLLSVEDKGEIPELFRARYFDRAPPGLKREVIVSSLSLSDEQAANVVKTVEADVARGEYNYDNYERNCATGVRDALFSDDVLGREIRSALGGSGGSKKSKKGSTENTSLQDIVLASIDRAIELSPDGKFRLLSPELARTNLGRQALGLLDMAGIASEFSSSGDFLDALKDANAVLELFSGRDSPLTKGFKKYFFAKKLTEKPIKKYAGLFMPERLRAALAEIQNPRTGERVIVSEREIRYRTDDDEDMADLRNARPTVIQAKSAEACEEGLPCGEVEGEDLGAPVL